MILKLSLSWISKKYIYYLLLFLIIYVVVTYFCNKKQTAMDSVPNHLHKYFMFVEKCARNNTIIQNLGDLSMILEELNNECEVMNSEQYGPIDSEMPIIVVQVHRDVERLQHLVVSLAQVTDIQSVLLIFSHSFYDEDINCLIRQIDFCMVLQIYYPKSVQLYPNDYLDCANETQDAKSYCAQRDARSAEAKNHWWWTANVVFDQLIWATIHKDMVIFINEDSYVLPDFVYMLRVAKFSLSYLSDVNVLSFGRPLASGLDYNKLIVDTWRPAYYNGLAFNRTTWKKIAMLSTYYCKYDDTSWSYSLMHLFEKFPQGRAVMVASMAPRVLSTGVFPSGRHALERIWSITTRDQLFPKKSHAVMLFGPDGRLLRNPEAPPKGNGGWSDSDYLLCSDPQADSITESDSTTTPPVFTNERE